MTQITDEQFIGALKTVAETMPDMVAAGNYMRSGVPYCVVGMALATIRLDLCPKDNNAGLAFPLLTGLGCSQKVGMAAAVAQYVNDVRQPFKVAWEVFNWALSRVPGEAELSPWEASTVVQNLCRDWEMRGLMAYIEKPEPVEVQSFSGQVLASTTFATGGIVSVSQEFATACNNLTAALNACSITFDSVTVNKVPAKKEHALVA